MFIKNRYFFFVLLFLTNCVFGQGVIEYTKYYNVDFYIFNSTNNILKKNINKSISKNSTPEELVQSYFFATDSLSLKSLFLDISDYVAKDQEHFEATKNMSYDGNYVTLLHKFEYLHQERQMCYINFIFKYENIDFTMPTNLSCIKKDDKWFIYQLGNQININQILWTFKSCKILQLIEGVKTNNPKMDNLISITKSSNNVLDINKLYNESQKFKDSDKDFFVMRKNNDCDDSSIQFINDKKVISSFLWQKISFEKLDNKENGNLIKSLKTNITDSICLDSRLSVEFDNKDYSILKYKNCLTNKTFSKVNSDNLPTVVEEFFNLLKNLDSKCISDLANQDLRSNNKNFVKIYEETRGQLNALNTTKLYNLFNKNKTLFAEFIDK